MAYGQCTSPTKLEESSLEMMTIANKLTAQEILNKRVKKFCEVTAKSGMHVAFSRIKDDFDLNKGVFTSDAELSKAIKTNPKEVNMGYEGSPWQLSLYPHVEIRKKAIEENLKNFGELPDLNQVKDFLKDSKSGVKRYKPYLTKYSKASSVDLPSLLLMAPNQQKDLKNGSGYISYALCMNYTLTHYKSCVKGLGKISKDLAPRGSIMAVPLLNKVLNDPSYNNGAAKAALKILARVETKSLTGNVFDDIFDSYKEAGMNEKDANEHAWNLIAVWSTRGANISILNDFATTDNLHTLKALSIISGAAPYLDQLRIDNGINPYSLPPEVKSTCTYGKVYHFWMSAYLAREIGNETGDPVGGMYAAYLAEMGYQMKSQTLGRDPNRAFVTETYSTANNKIRIDLAHGSAGAVYGMKAASGKKIDSMSIDTAIFNLVKDAEKKPVLTEAEANEEWNDYSGVGGYLRWKEIFAPDSALKTYYP